MTQLVTLRRMNPARWSSPATYSNETPIGCRKHSLGSCLELNLCVLWPSSQGHRSSGRQYVMECSLSSVRFILPAVSITPYRHEDDSLSWARRRLSWTSSSFFSSMWSNPLQCLNVWSIRGLASVRMKGRNSLTSSCRSSGLQESPVSAQWLTILISSCL